MNTRLNFLFQYAAALIFAGSAALMASCDDDDDNSTSATAGQVENTLQGNGWHVTYFFDTGDETSHFSGYTFTFENDGTVTASKTGTTVNGTWSVTSSSSGGVKLNLDFGSTVPFDELNDDWKVIERTDKKIRLEDVSGGSGETDYLTFERN